MKLLKFYGTWCGPCKVLSKQLEGFEMDGITEIENIDVDMQQERSESLKVNGIPLLILVDENEKELWRHKGLINQDELKIQLEPFQLKPLMKTNLIAI